MNEFRPHDHEGRRARLASLLHPLELDVLLCSDPISVRWLTGFTGSNGQVLVDADGGSLLVTDARYDGRAATEAPDVERRLDRDPVAVLLAWSQGPRLGFEAGHLSHRAGVDLGRRVVEAGRTATATDDVVGRLRVSKEPSEVERLRSACRLTDVAVTDVWRQVDAGWTEIAIARAITRRMEDLGADGPAFAPIVASGPNGAVPHHDPGLRELREGELVTIDCGAMVDGYHADWTRTLPVGEVHGELREVHDIVHEAQAAGRAAARAGVRAHDLDAACRNVIGDAGYGDAFLHGTGHGVGLVIHEAPMVGRDSTATVPASATVTVEPGIYLPGIGGVRIEDTVLVTSDGPCESLTTSPRHLP